MRVIVLLTLIPIVFSLNFGINPPVSTNPPAHGDTSLLITEVYSIPLLDKNSTYIEIYNPTNAPIPLSHCNIATKRGNISFPNGHDIQPKEYIVTAYNATGFYNEFGFYPDFEVVDTSPLVPDVLGTTWWDADDFIVLQQGAHVDSVIYGNQSIPPGSEWSGSNAPRPHTGLSLLRDYDGSMAYVDMNTRNDWIIDLPSPKAHSNCSHFKTIEIQGIMDIATFVFPDNGYELISSLINNSYSEIYFEMYFANQKQICDLFLNAMSRGVKVKGILESDTKEWSVFIEDGEIFNNQQVLFAKLIDLHPLGEMRWANRYFSYTLVSMIIIDNVTVVIMRTEFTPEGVSVSRSYGHRGWGVAVRSFEVARAYLDVFERDFILASPFNETLCVTPAESLNETIPLGNYNKSFEYTWYNGVNATIRRIVSPSYYALATCSDIITSATNSLYVDTYQMDYSWGGGVNPILEAIDSKVEQNIITRVILDSRFCDSSKKEVYNSLLARGVNVYWANISPDGLTSHYLSALIVDNLTLLLGSIEFTSEGIFSNRGISIALTCQEVVPYFANVFLFDLPSPTLECHVPSKIPYNESLEFSCVINNTGIFDVSQLRYVLNGSESKIIPLIRSQRNIYLANVTPLAWNTTVDLFVVVFVPEKGVNYTLYAGNYVVTDPYPPIITCVRNHTQIIYNISEPTNASGVNKTHMIFMWRINNTEWHQIFLPSPSGVVTPSFQTGQPVNGSVVEYKIIARDLAGNENIYHRYFLIGAEGAVSLLNFTIPSRIYAGERMNATFLIFAENGIQGVYFEYKDDTEWRRISTTCIAGDCYYGNYSVELPSQFSGVVEWRLVVIIGDEEIECASGQYVVEVKFELDNTLLVIILVISISGGATFLLFKVYSAFMRSAPVKVISYDHLSDTQKPVPKPAVIELKNLDYSQVARRITSHIYSTYRIPVAVGIFEKTKPLYRPSEIKKANISLEKINNQVEVLNEDTIAISIGDKVFVILGNHISASKIRVVIYEELISVLNSFNAEFS